MPVEYWQIDLAPYVSWPGRPNGLLLLGSYLLVTGGVLFRQWRELLRLSVRRWAGLLVWLVAAPVFSTILSIELSGRELLPPPGIPTDPVPPSLVPLAYVPVVVVSGLFGVAPAILVAAAGGVARGLWDTHRAFTPFELMLAAGVIAGLIRQEYRGQLPRLLRRPVVAAVVAGLVVWPISYLSFWVSASAARPFSADYVTSLWAAHGLPLFLELLVAGLVGELIRYGWPKLWFTSPARRPPPYSVSLNSRLLYSLIPLAVFGIALIYWAHTRIAVDVATSVVVDLMERDAQNAAKGIPYFVRAGESLILDLARDERLQSPEPGVRERQLSEGIRAVAYFRQLVYFDATGSPLASYPEVDVTQLGLTTRELADVNVALHGVPQTTPVYSPQRGGMYLLSFIAPVSDPATGMAVGALLGRADIESNPLLQPVISSLQGLLVGSGTGFITDESNAIIFHPDRTRLREIWVPAETEDTLPTSVEGGRAYRDRAADGSQRLVYYLPVSGHPWQVGVVVPNSVVLDQATRITRPLVGILTVIGGVGLVALLAISTRLIRPLKTLAVAAERIARGEFERSEQVAGADEVGRLGEAFERMRARLSARLGELNLLLDVSQAVAGSLSLNDSLPPILSGALTATEAAGARLAVLRRDDPQAKPQSYAAGDGAHPMATLDAQILELAAAEGPIVIENLARARAVLDVSQVGRRIQALIALPLRHEMNYLGVLWLGYDRPHAFSETETNFLTTLAGQAAVAIANAQLYEASEGGRRQLAAIVSSTPDAVVVGDQHGRLLLLNPAAEAMLGINGAASSGQLLREVIERPELVELMHAADGLSAPQEILLPDGRTFYATASPILSGAGRTLGRVIVLRDVTHFKQLDQLKSEFVATVSHDLRAPLTFMRGYASMLSMVGKLNTQQQEFAVKIVEGIEQMSQLIDNLLDLNRIEAGVDLALETCQLADIVEYVTSRLQPKADNKRIRFVVELERDLPTIRCDETLVRQAIANLIDNALKYTSAGGTVRVSGDLRDASIIFAVRDTGIGISQTDQVRLFERFYRVKRDDTQAIKGSGLGLAIVKSIVERHGGRVWVESRLGQGSTFSFTIPVYEE